MNQLLLMPPNQPNQTLQEINEALKNLNNWSDHFEFVLFRDVKIGKMFRFDGKFWTKASETRALPRLALEYSGKPKEFSPFTRIAKLLKNR